MPVLYPGLLDDDEVAMIAEHLKTSIVNKNGPTSGYVPPKSDGTAEWQAIYSVMVSPRCINCHSVANYPRQTDDRYPHVFHVLRGADNKGVEMKHCDQCHGVRNNPETGAPGRMEWTQAPIERSTEASPGVPKSGHQLCVDLKDKTKNGNRDFAGLLDFVETDALVMWAWDPGIRANGKARTAPPMATHDDFVITFNKWLDSGGPCPTS